MLAQRRDVGDPRTLVLDDACTPWNVDKGKNTLAVDGTAPDPRFDGAWEKVG